MAQDMQTESAIGNEFIDPKERNASFGEFASKFNCDPNESDYSNDDNDSRLSTI